MQKGWNRCLVSGWAVVLCPDLTWDVTYGSLSSTKMCLTNVRAAVHHRAVLETSPSKLKHSRWTQLVHEAGGDSPGKDVVQSHAISVTQWLSTSRALTLKPWRVVEGVLSSPWALCTSPDPVFVWIFSFLHGPRLCLLLIVRRQASPPGT